MAKMVRKPIKDRNYLTEIVDNNRYLDVIQSLYKVSFDIILIFIQFEW